MLPLGWTRYLHCTIIEACVACGTHVITDWNIIACSHDYLFQHSITLKEFRHFKVLKKTCVDHNVLLCMNIIKEMFRLMNGFWGYLGQWHHCHPATYIARVVYRRPWQYAPHTCKRTVNYAERPCWEVMYQKMVTVTITHFENLVDIPYILRQGRGAQSFFFTAMTVNRDNPTTQVS